MMKGPELSRALEVLYPSGGCTVVRDQIVKVPGGTPPTEAELAAALAQADEALRVAEVEFAASEHIAASLSATKQAEALMKAVLALYQDMNNWNRLSQETKDSMAPLLALASKIQAVHAERDRVKANPGLSKADANFPAL